MAGIPLLKAHTYGEALTLLRARSKLNRDDVAEAAEVATGTVSRYERDVIQRPDVDTIRKLVKTLAEATGANPRVLWREIEELLDRQKVSTTYVAAQVRAVQRGDRKRAARK